MAGTNEAFIIIHGFADLVKGAYAIFLAQSIEHGIKNITERQVACNKHAIDYKYATALLKFPYKSQKIWTSMKRHGSPSTQGNDNKQSQTMKAPLI